MSETKKPPDPEWWAMPSLEEGSSWTSTGWFPVSDIDRIEFRVVASEDGSPPRIVVYFKPRSEPDH